MANSARARFDLQPHAAQPATYLEVELSSEGATERVGGRQAVFVPRKAIVRVDLRRGVAGERPILQLLFGSALVAAGIYISAVAAGCLDWGAHLAKVLAASGVPMAILGGWVLWRGIRRAYYLHVRTRDDARKLVLGSRVDLAEVSALLEAARSRFGYVVGWDIEEARPPW